MKNILKELNIKTPKDEYQKQKTKVADKWCNHLKEIYTREGEISNDKYGSITIQKTFCSQCHKELSENDLKERQRLLTKFKK